MKKIIALLYFFFWAFLCHAEDNRLFVRKLKKENLTFVPQIHHSSSVDRVAWSPSGRFLASASEQGAVKIWDTKENLLFHTVRNRGPSVKSLIWSPNGRWLSWSDDSVSAPVVVWNLRKRKPYALITKEVWKRKGLQGLRCRFGAYSLSWSSDSQILAWIGRSSLCDERTIRGSDANRSFLVKEYYDDVQFWSAKKKRIDFTLFSKLHQEIGAIQWKPKSKKIALGRKREIHIFSTKERRVTQTYSFNKPSAVVDRLSWSGTGEFLAASNDIFLSVFDILKKRVVYKRKINSSSGGSLQFVGGEKYIAWTTLRWPAGKGAIEIFSMKDGKVVEQIVSHRGALFSLSVHPKNNNLLAVGGDDASVRIWDIQKKKLEKIFSSASIEKVFVDRSSSGNRIITHLSRHGILQCWDTKAKKRIFWSKKTPKQIYFLSWNPQRTHFLFVKHKHSKEIYIWDAKAEKVVHSLKSKDSWFSRASWNLTGNYIATVDRIGLRVWRFPKMDLQFYAHLQIDRGNFYDDTDWSPDGKLYALSDYFGALYIVEINKKTLLYRSFFNEREFKYLQWSPKNRFLAIANADGNGGIVWDMRTKTKKIYYSKMGKKGFVFARLVTWSPDEKQFAILDEYEDAFVWRRNRAKNIAVCKISKYARPYAVGLWKRNVCASSQKCARWVFRCKGHTSYYIVSDNLVWWNHHNFSGPKEFFRIVNQKNVMY